MKRFQFLKKDRLSKLPDGPGVYSFFSGKEFLYIGKAVNIEKRIRSHFNKNSYKSRLFIKETEKIGYIRTDSEIEALLLEADLIKKHKPRYNVVWKDDKNFFYVAFTKEKLPRIFITHQTKNQQDKSIEYLGPFIEGSNLKKTLKLLRNTFPYYTVKKHGTTLCPWCYLNLCPGPSPDLNIYRKNIKALSSIIRGKEKSVLNNLKKQMKRDSNAQNYEKAARTRDQIESLENVLMQARIFNEIEAKNNWLKTEKDLRKMLKAKKPVLRIESYDISNIQGQQATGSMITFIKGKPEKNFYRRFKIKISGKPNDTLMIKEILSRRLNHSEWPFPELFLIDGGIAQLNTAIEIKNKKAESRSIKVAAIAKKKNELYLENIKKPLLLKNLSRGIFNLILQLRDEAHRFAIAYHRQLRQKALLNPADRKGC